MIRQGDRAQRFYSKSETLPDTHIVGEFEFGPYEILQYELSFKNEGDKRKLLLRVAEADLSSDTEYWRSATKKAYYHGGGLAEELVALSSLFLRRKVELGPQVRENDFPRYFPKTKGKLDKDLTFGQSDLNELDTWFEALTHLDPQYHQKYILAVRLYHRAILTLDEEPDLAYLNLVSAIEALCQVHELKFQPTFSEVKPNLDKQLHELIEDEQLRQRVEEAILDNERLIGRRFVAFILDYCDESFWNYGLRAEHGKILKEDLPKYLKNIYGQRSRTLHNGEPFPAYIDHPTREREEAPLGLSISYMGKLWTPNDYIPHIHFFERLVNHVLKNFLTRNQKKEMPFEDCSPS